MKIGIEQLEFSELSSVVIKNEKKIIKINCFL